MVKLLPQHEQHYPDKLLSTRLEEYVFDDGMKMPSTNRAFAKRLTGIAVLKMVQEVQTRLNLKDIDPRYFVGTCFHESGCTNEWDTEIASKTCIGGFQSVGAYQIGKEEAERYGFGISHMLDLGMATQCMIKLASYNREHIRYIAKLGSTLDPDYTDEQGVVWKAGTMRAYLAICHNHGTGYVGDTIRKYGLDWGAYQRRNPTDNIVAHSYGQDCITGGPNYPTATTAEGETIHRVLQLTDPIMRGNDVMELQRHLKISTDSVFGPDTETALIRFQKIKGLKPDGICGPVTWKAALSS